MAAITYKGLTMGKSKWSSNAETLALARKASLPVLVAELHL